jgi:hypothetical protein
VICITAPGQKCDCDYCVEVPELPACANYDVVCYKRYIEAAVKTATRLMYISPQVVDLAVKIKHIDSVLSRLPQTVPIKAAHTPWGPILYASKDVAIPHYNPRYVIRMKEKEYDDFDTLGTIADAVSTIISTFGTYPPLMQLFGTAFIKMVTESNVGIFIQYKIETDGLKLVVPRICPGVLKFAADGEEFTVRAFAFTGQYGNSPTLVATSFSKSSLVRGIDDWLCPSYEKCRYQFKGSAAVTIGNVLASEVGFEPLNLLVVHAMDTSFSTYFGRHRIEEPGSYAVNQSAVRVNIEDLLSNVLRALRNIAEPGATIPTDVQIKEYPACQ